MAEIYEGAYLPPDNPRAQSGFGGGEARWEAGRRAIVETIDPTAASSTSAARTAS